MQETLSYSPNFEENIAMIYALKKYCSSDSEIEKLIDCYINIVYNNYIEKKKLEATHCPSFYYISDSQYNEGIINKLLKM